jgi:hypothetical protein
MTGHHPGPPSYYWTITQLKLKAFSNEMNPNPIIFLNQPMTFYYYIKGAITVPTEYFKYYHATCGVAAQLIFTPSSALPELASCVFSCIFWHFVMKIWWKFVQIGCIFRGCSVCLPEGVLILTNLVSIVS